MWSISRKGFISHFASRKSRDQDLTLRLSALKVKWFKVSSDSQVFNCEYLKFRWEHRCIVPRVSCQKWSHRTERTPCNEYYFLFFTLECLKFRTYLTIFYYLRGCTSFPLQRNTTRRCEETTRLHDRFPRETLGAYY